MISAIPRTISMYLIDCKLIRLRLRTGLVRNCGERETVQGYIDLLIRRLNCSNRVYDTALKMYNYMAQKTIFTGQSPSTMAIALVNLAAILMNQKIPYSKWSSICAYSTVMTNSNKLKGMLEKVEEFSNLKSHRIGR